MNSVLYENRCKCNEEVSIIKKQKIGNRSEGKPFLYPNPKEIRSKIFKIRYEKNLSTLARLLFNSFQNKYLYYAIDDISYSLKSNLSERDNLLAILYSSVISLQNNFSVNFFDIWIHEIYINEIKTNNKFLLVDSKNSESITYITIKLLYRTKIPVKKQMSLW